MTEATSLRPRSSRSGARPAATAGTGATTPSTTKCAGAISACGRGAAGELSSWEASDDGALALVIVLDQFPRNMFRGDVRTYSSDALAREVASRAIDRGADARIDPLCGNSSTCRSCIRSIWPTSCAASSCPQAGNAENLKYAEDHADIIRRFGRFPHRNRILGRTTTPEEQAFLDEGAFRADDRTVNDRTIAVSPPEYCAGHRPV